MTDYSLLLSRLMNHSESPENSPSLDEDLGAAIEAIRALQQELEFERAARAINDPQMDEAVEKLQEGMKLLLQSRVRK